MLCLVQTSARDEGGVRGVGGVCAMCLARGGVGGERIVFGLYQSCRYKWGVRHRSFDVTVSFD